MELVIGRDLLDQSAVILKDDEVAQVIQQVLFLEDAAHQRLQLAKLSQRVALFAVDGPPRHKALFIGGERTHPRIDAVGRYQHFIGAEQLRYLFLVGLELPEGCLHAAVSLAAFFSSKTATGIPFRKTTTSGRRSRLPLTVVPITVNWFTTSQSFCSGLAKSASRTRSLRVSPSCCQKTCTPRVSSR
jgi:hypothetical protein